LENQIKLYPNPTSGAITLELGTLNLDLIRVVDSRGRVVREITACESNCRIDISDAVDGVYQLVFITSDGVYLTKSVVLQR